MIKKGPANYPEVVSQYSANNKWSDSDFTGNNTLYDAFTASSTITNYDNYFASSTYAYYYDWLSAKYPNSNIFDTDGSPNWLEPNQGGAGTCYLMQAMSGVGEFPQLIKDTFLTQERNDAGIYALRIFLRGKPYVITIDDEFLFKYPNYGTYLVNAQPSTD